MRDLVKRALREPRLTAELLRRGMFDREETKELVGAGFMPVQVRFGLVQLATLLAAADSQLTARAVLRDVLRPEELQWLERLLRFQKRNDKRDELIRAVERALEGRKGNVRQPR